MGIPSQGNKYRHLWWSQCFVVSIEKPTYSSPPAWWGIRLTIRRGRLIVGGRLTIARGWLIEDMGRLIVSRDLIWGTPLTSSIQHIKTSIIRYQLWRIFLWLTHLQGSGCQ